MATTGLMVTLGRSRCFPQGDGPIPFRIPIKLYRLGYYAAKASVAGQYCRTMGVKK